MLAFSLLPLHEQHWPDILVPSLEEIEDDRDKQSADQHYTGPIHRTCSDRCDKRPSKEEDQRRQESQGRNIDEKPETAQSPSSWRQGWPTHAAVNDTADGDEV